VRTGLSRVLPGVVFALAVVNISAQTSTSAQTAALFEGARVIVDTRRPPIENAALLIDDGRIVKVGKRGEVRAPAGAARIDLTGKTVMPALIDSHVHLGYQKGLSYAAGNFTRENLIDQLNRYAYVGVAAVLSLGTDPGDGKKQKKKKKFEKYYKIKYKRKSKKKNLK